MPERYTGTLEQIDAYRWRLARNPEAGMLAEGIIYADGALMADLRGDNSLWQVANVACLPGIVGPSLAMPDCHYGYGFPIGGVAAFDVETGIISPGGVGYDINCGVRLLRTDLTEAEVRPRLDKRMSRLFSSVPSGVGSEKGAPRLTQRELDRVLVEGAAWVVHQGQGTAADLAATEEGGALGGADPTGLTPRARERALPQLASLGSGNHFLEVQVLETVYDAQAAGAMGLHEPGQVTVMIHCGSRGFGHQVCEDALDVMQQAAVKYGIELPDRQLACAPIPSPEGREYFAQMAAAANYAWANRQAIMHRVREVFEEVFAQSWERLGLGLVWDVAHNIAKFEEHAASPPSPLSGTERGDKGRLRLCVHRKGATRAFGPGHPEVPERYRQIGQPVIVPGDMGSGSYVLVGTEQAMRETWGSTCHGAGRQMSRHAALKAKRGSQVIEELAARGIILRAADKRTVAEEMPEAYKNVDQVVEVCHGAGISRKVARMRPIGVMKG
ncbi:MAG: RtcB family protein [candidate division WS1 bacterium]|nr:RtcB family protein [candidate division WS1 bacterium]